MIYDLDSTFIRETLEEGRIVWAMFNRNALKELPYDQEEWWTLDYEPPTVCADTREELLTHLISQKREAIAELERAIEGLDALREVAA